MIKNPLLDALTNGHDHLPGSIYRQELFRAGHILRIVDTRDQLVDLPHTPLSTWPRALCIAGGAPGNFRQCMRPSASVWPCKKTKQSKRTRLIDTSIKHPILPLATLKNANTYTTTAVRYYIGYRYSSNVRRIFVECLCGELNAGRLTHDMRFWECWYYQMGRCSSSPSLCSTKLLV